MVYDEPVEEYEQTIQFPKAVQSFSSSISLLFWFQGWQRYRSGPVSLLSSALISDTAW